MTNSSENKTHIGSNTQPPGSNAAMAGGATTQPTQVNSVQPYSNVAVANGASTNNGHVNHNVAGGNTVMPQNVSSNFFPGHMNSNTMAGGNTAMPYGASSNFFPGHMNSNMAGNYAPMPYGASSNFAFASPGMPAMMHSNMFQGQQAMGYPMNYGYNQQAPMQNMANHQIFHSNMPMGYAQYGFQAAMPQQAGFQNMMPSQPIMQTNPQMSSQATMSGGAVRNYQMGSVIELPDEADPDASRITEEDFEMFDFLRGARELEQTLDCKDDRFASKNDPESKNRHGGKAESQCVESVEYQRSSAKEESGSTPKSRP